MITIFVGDCTEDLAVAAKQIDQNASLIEHSNANQLLVDGTYYTSLSDLPSVNLFVKILNQADTIVYSPPIQWSDLKNGVSYQQKWTEFYCLFFNDKKIVNGIDKISMPGCQEKMLTLADSRSIKTKKQLWIAGDSLSHGIGVSPNDRYGKILANALNIPVSFLTQPSSSIDWAADQILRSDIRAGDIVVWGLTVTNRLTFMNDDCSIVNVGIGHYTQYPEFHKTIPIELLCYEQNNMFYALRNVHKVINFCSKINATLIIAGLLVDPQDLVYFYNLPNFIQLYGVNGLNKDQIYLDFGNDNEHPGKITHQWYANELLKVINKCK